MPTAIPNLGNGPIAISLVGDQSVAIAGPDGKAVELTLADGKQLLQDHPAATFITDNAVKLHYALAGAFAGDQASLGLLWDLSASGRLIDIVLLDQRLQAADRGVHSKRRTVKQLLATRAKLVAEHVVPPHPLADLQWLHRRFAEETAKLSGRDVADAILERAPFGTALDLQGTIALEAVKNRGIQLDEDQVQQLIAAAEIAFTKAAQAIRTHGTLNAGFRWCADKTKILLDDNGRPTTLKAELRRCLKNLAKKSADYSATLRYPPLDDRGQISVLPGHWRHWCHPAIEAWLDLDAAAAVLRSIGADKAMHLNFTAIPQILFKDLDFSDVRRFRPKPFRARAGYKFAVVTLGELEMRCFAHVLDWYVPSGAFPSKMYRIGKDPIEETAAGLWVADRGAPEDGARSGFVDLPPMERLRWMTITHVLYQSVARGHSSQEIRWALKTEMPDEDFDEQAIEKLQHNLRNERPEFRDVLDEDRILRLLSEWPNGSANDLAKTARGKGYPETAARAARNAALENGPIEQQLEWPHSSIGRLCSPTFPTQVHTAECRELEDEIRVSVLYGLVRAGWFPVGFAGGDFVIEVPADQATPDVLQQIEQVCTHGVLAITDDSIFDCFSGRWADRW